MNVFDKRSTAQFRSETPQIPQCSVNDSKINITEVLQATNPHPVTQGQVGAATGDSKWDMTGIGDFKFFPFKSFNGSNAFSFLSKICVGVLDFNFKHC